MLTQAVREGALGLGFELVGIAAADDFERWDFYGEWIERGYAGAMGYLVDRRPQRRSPRELMPGCRSVVCVARNYHVGPAPEPGELEGWISRYAWGSDYHTEMKAGLTKLLELTRRLGGEGRVFVDTGPILEREAAMRSGIGFIGKNTCLISQKLGSWIFLGELLSSLELTPDPPAVPRCGTCTRCLDACPTKAFVGPYLLDATRCIAYLTIELRGAIPRELRPLIGTHVFGCDICQEVCPWNRFAQATDRAAYQPRQSEGLSLRAPDLISLLELDESGFQRLFRDSPVKRAKRRGLRRNVVVALGNTRSAEAVPALGKALEDPEPLVRSHAAWALGQIGGASARALLLDRQPLESDPETLEELRHALQEKL